MSQLISFGMSLIETARTWVDEASLVMPGYRDRVVTVYTDGDEGGLNLSMPTEVVTRLSTRGRFAAQQLVERFGPDRRGLEQPSLAPVPRGHRRPQRMVRRFREGLHRTGPDLVRRDSHRSGEPAVLSDDG